MSTINAPLPSWLTRTAESKSAGGPPPIRVVSESDAAAMAATTEPWWTYNDHLVARLVLPRSFVEKVLANPDAPQGLVLVALHVALATPPYDLVLPHVPKHASDDTLVTFLGIATNALDVDTTPVLLEYMVLTRHIVTQHVADILTRSTSDHTIKFATQVLRTVPLHHLPADILEHMVAHLHANDKRLGLSSLNADFLKDIKDAGASSGAVPVLQLLLMHDVGFGPAAAKQLQDVLRSVWSNEMEQRVVHNNVQYTDAAVRLLDRFMTLSDATGGEAAWTAIDDELR